MKGPIIILILVTILFGAGFIHFEKKKGTFETELDELKAEYRSIMEKQDRISVLKKKRAEYFRKVFILNRPYELSSSMTIFMSILTRFDNRKIGITGITISRGTGVFNFTITGRFNETMDLIGFSDKLESSARAFIISRQVSGDRGNLFSIAGEVHTE